MTRVAPLLLLIAPVVGSGACTGDGPKSQQEARAQAMAILPVAASAGPAEPRPADAPASPPQSPNPIAAAPAGATTNAGAGTFEAVARPVLVRSCAPCHEPGGQMYGKLPFDKADVVSSHPTGVLKRLKGDDKRTIEAWLASNPPPRPAL